MKETISTLLSKHKICPIKVGHKKTMNNVKFERQQVILQYEMAMEDAEFEKQQNLLSYMLENELSYPLGNDIADDTYLEDII